MINNDIKHFTVRISGHVQGVFFRASAADKARQLRLSGFVRNERDGTVYMEVEGETERLRKFLEWSAVGPPRATVETCEVKEGQLKNFSDFEIQR